MSLIARRFLRLVLPALTGALLATPAAAQAPVPTAGPAPLALEAFFREAAISEAKLSPTGEHLAFRLGGAGQRDRLVVIDLATMKPAPVAHYDNADVAGFRWVSERRLVFDTQDKKLATGETFLGWGLFALDLDGKNPRTLISRSWGTAGRTLAWNNWLVPETGAMQGDEVLVASPDQMTDKGWDDFVLKRLNTATGVSRDVPVPRWGRQWWTDEQLQVQLVRTERENRTALHVRQGENGWRVLREFERYGFDAEFRPVAWMGGGKLLVASRKGRDTEALFEFDLATDRMADKPLVEHPRYDIAPVLLRRDGRLLGLSFVADAWVTVWFDEAMKGHQAEIDRLLPGTSNRIEVPRRGTSPWLLVRAEADVQPALFFLYHTGTRRLARVGAEMPEIDARRMGPMDLVRIRARDGLEFPAWLTLPAGTPAGATAGEKKKHPLVLYVHGGPWGRGAHWRWQPEVQFLASRGYAVLQPEFRGSTGYGFKLFEASFKQWGRTMQDDLVDAVKWAVEQGHADPARVCIVGASYGGYAALMGLARDGGVYRCGVAFAAVSDLMLLIDARWSDLPDEYKAYGLPRMLGDRERDRAQLEATSPIRLAAQIRQPLLIGHGRIDRRVPIEHGRRMADAVKAHNPGLEYVEYADEAHGLSLLATERDWWRRVDAFLAKNLAAPAR